MGSHKTKEVWLSLMKDNPEFVLLKIYEYEVRIRELEAMVSKMLKDKKELILRHHE